MILKISLFSKRVVVFDLIDNTNVLPESIKKLIKNNTEKSLTIEYDKKEYNLSEIIKELNDNNILFSELKTHDEDLESIFLKITSDSK